MFPKHLSSLLSRNGYFHQVAVIKLVTTHISWVLLTGEFAYKIKRPVQYDFVDMRSLERRRHFCEEEIRLNRRFAPDMYLDVCEIVMIGGEARMGGKGEIVDYAVRMRQFEREEELDRLLDAARVAPAELEAFGLDLARIHARLPATATTESSAEPSRIRALVIRNLTETAQAAIVFEARQRIESLAGALLQRLEKCELCLRTRREMNRIRECHGDLHVGNIVRRAAGLVAFDCVEFEPEFRWIDVADEIALLLADLESRGYSEHAHAFLGGYLGCSGDYQACRVLAPYKAHRALVRAKVAALTARSGVPAESLPSRRCEFDRLVNCARECLGQKSPILIMMCGLSGSGKTWLATQLATRLQLIHVRSDIERKRSAGLGALTRSAASAEQGLYSRALTEAVYEQLARDADDVLAGGYGVVLDATFGKRDARRRIRDLSKDLGVRFWAIQCTAPVEVLRTRIAQRHLASDASDADETILDWQLRQFEPICLDEGLEVLEADTSDPKVVLTILNAVADTGPMA